MSESQILALLVARSVAACDGRALFVGGFVRDRLLRKESTDIDIEVYGLTAQQLQEILARIGSVNTVGASFSVFKLVFQHAFVRTAESVRRTLSQLF